MIDIKLFLEQHKEQLPAIFQKAEITSISESKEKTHTIKTLHSKKYKTNRQQVTPFYKDIVRYL